MAGRLILEPHDLPIHHQALGLKYQLERTDECCDWDLVIRAHGYHRTLVPFGTGPVTRVFVSEVRHEPTCEKA